MKKKDKQSVLNNDTGSYNLKKRNRKKKKVTRKTEYAANNSRNFMLQGAHMICSHVLPNEPDLPGEAGLRSLSVAKFPTLLLEIRKTHSILNHKRRAVAVDRFILSNKLYCCTVCSPKELSSGCRQEVSVDSSNISPAAIKRSERVETRCCVAAAAST